MRAAYATQIIYMLPTLASSSLEEMLQARAPDQVLFYQLYVNPDRSKTASIIKEAERGGVKALFVTVDAPSLGRRERDMRNKFKSESATLQKGSNIQRNQGVAVALSQFIDPSLNWSDIKWLRSVTSLKIVLKGIQTAEDALLAYQHGVDGIVLSNHGGRQLDFAPSGIEILPEVITTLHAAGADTKVKFQVFVDGGVRRGSDVFKALALGATAVGIGRPALFGLAGYSQQGVEHVVNILKSELEMVMRLMGAPKIQNITRNMVNIDNLTHHTTSIPTDHLALQTYIPRVPAKL